ncbi:aldose 1-epimerase family protein [Butyrivibrio sp. INlla16]|uniref:aldose 1-epimerase family protein n=1 Tax=Butyrivibrio sp. INlla16 TaxID=1520807 RepID=UPI00088456CB|nr:aldose 1-epimerase family protein [Butyrivibrio sp. INlla16]SDB14649.1 Galactose mutarotase [Butyrivibrio sp. INlla16]
MRTSLTNNVIIAEIETAGAELKSIKKGGKEYMWCADPAFWNRTSPVLFPFVGAVADGKYRVGGHEYPMGQHGFARDMEFELEEKADDCAVFSLTSNETTLSKYPFDFKLTISYKLDGDSIIVGWKVENTGKGDMPFAIGAHPAFNCELSSEGTLKGNSVVLKTDKDVLTVRKFHDPLAANETYELTLKSDKSFEVDEHTFDGGAIILENSQVSGASIKNAEGDVFVEMAFDAPLLGIWSPVGKNAPFICLEPWYGRADAEGFSGELKDRDFEQLLNPGDAFDTEYRVSFK